MANEEELHRCITAFMLDTTECTKNEHASEVQFIRLSMQIINSNTEVEILISGSSAEFYINPMLSSIGDVDIMTRSKDMLAIPYGYEISSDWCQTNVTHVIQIIDSHKPGYVYLQRSCILSKNDSSGCVVKNIDSDAAFFVANFEPARYERCYCENSCLNSFAKLLIPLVFSYIRHGPADKVVRDIKFSDSFTPSSFLLSNTETVVSFRCPIWPPLAAGWPTRSRDHSWPDPTTINLVVSNACDVVGAVHPSCRQDEWMNIYQWRLSFSRAEVTLLNSWTPVQQIIYHMLRLVLKREVLSEIKDNEPYLPKLSNYNIKTLMLWECEQKPPSWWLTESSLVKLCSLLLHKLSDWVADKQCQHYFISKCNLLDDFSDESSQTFCNKVRSLANVAFLLIWFFENYICNCAPLCPENVSKLFEEFHCSSKFEKATCAIIDWKLCMLPCERFSDNCESEKMMLSFQLSCNLDTLASPTVRRGLQKFRFSATRLFHCSDRSVGCIYALAPLTD